MNSAFRSGNSIITVILTLLLSICFNACSDKEKQDVQENNTSEINYLSQQEKEDGWKLLFDGTDLSDWRGANKKYLPEEGWKVENDILTVMASDGSQEGWGGDIVTRETYSNFELSLEFKLTEGANSGIKYYVLEDTYEEGAALGLEYQLLDDERHPDAKQGRGGNRTVASLYDLIPADNDKPINPVGEWNHARIVASNDSIEHWLNGEKVLEYDRISESFRNLISQSKYSVYENFGEAEEGHILLQDHGDEVFFRNIKINDLSDNES